MKLISLLPINLREAEKEEEPAADDAADSAEAGAGEEGGEENPFADTDAASSDTDAEEEKEDEGDASKKEGGLDIVFNTSKVRKYNDVKFRDNKGTVVAISRFGLTVKLPNEQTILVNFDDIL